MKIEPLLQQPLNIKNTTMKQLLMLAFSFSAFTAVAQDNKGKKGIYVGYNFSPDYSYRTLHNIDILGGDFMVKSRNDYEDGKFGFTTGLRVGFDVSSSLQLETGLQFSNKGYKTKNSELVYIDYDPNAPTKARFNYNYKYLGIPLNARFSFGENKLRIVASAGVMTNFLLNVKHISTYEYASSRKERISQSYTFQYKKIDLSPMLGLGFDFKLTSKINLLLEPTFRYNILRTFDGGIAEHLWGAGLNCGVNYSLR